MKVFKYKDQSVVVWAVHLHHMGDAYNEVKVNVRFSQLECGGGIGELKSVVIYESDYFNQFQSTDKVVGIKWQMGIENKGFTSREYGILYSSEPFVGGMRVKCFL